MIIVKLKGGLGNQMFQYALGRRLSLINHSTLKLDVSAYQKSNDRQYSLEEFNIQAHICIKKNLKKYFNSTKLFDKFKPYYLRSEINETKPYFDKFILKNHRHDIYLTGYWASWKYFKDIEPLIKKDFVLKYNVLPKMLPFIRLTSKKDSVAIHIRRGDFLSKDYQAGRYYFNLSYYQKCLKMLSKKIARPHILVFSDDIDWVRRNWKTDFPTEYISGKGLSDCQEIILMSKCQHEIFSDSTFGWWGAWLNNYSNKIVITTNQWLKDGIINDMFVEDLIPKKWITI